MLALFAGFTVGSGRVVSFFAHGFGDSFGGRAW